MEQTTKDKVGGDIFWQWSTSSQRRATRPQRDVTEAWFLRWKWAMARNRAGTPGPKWREQMVGHQSAAEDTLIDEIASYPISSKAVLRKLCPSTETMKRWEDIWDLWSLLYHIRPLHSCNWSCPRCSSLWNLLHKSMIQQRPQEARPPCVGREIWRVLNNWFNCRH